MGYFYSDQGSGLSKNPIRKFSRFKSESLSASDFIIDCEPQVRSRLLIYTRK